MRLGTGILVTLATLALGCAGGAPQSQPQRSAPAPVTAPAPVVATPGPLLMAEAEPPLAPLEAATPSRPQPVVEVAPAPPTPSSPSYAPTSTDLILLQRATVFIEELAVAMETNQDSCERMATSFQGVLSRNKDLISQAKELKGNAARDAWFQKQAQNTLMPAVQRMIQPMTKCASDPHMQAVIKSLN